jgi:hypothetical protein
MLQVGFETTEKSVRVVENSISLETRDHCDGPYLALKYVRI